MVSNFQLLETTEKNISNLKKIRGEIFSIKNNHFGWSETYSIKQIRNYPELQKKLELNNSNLKSVVEHFKKWKDIPTYLTFQDEKGNLFCSLASKRGNKPYEYYLNRNLTNQLKFMKNPNFHKLILRNKKGFKDKKVSNVCFITLTCDPKKYGNSILKSWLGIEKEYNLFITRFRKKFGKCWVMKAVEATKKGFPHIHLLVITEKEFDVFKPTKRKCGECKQYFNTNSKHYFVTCPHCNYKISHPYRMCLKKDIENYWSHIWDLLTPDNSKMKKDGCVDFMRDYIFKDMLKSYVYKKDRSDENYLSLSINWFLGKQCYSISDEKNLTFDLIKDTSVTQTQIKDILNKNSKKHFIFLGLLDFKFFNKNPPPVSLKISKTDENYLSCLNGVYGKREKFKIKIIETPSETKPFCSLIIKQGFYCDLNKTISNFEFIEFQPEKIIPTSNVYIPKFENDNPSYILKSGKTAGQFEREERKFRRYLKNNKLTSNDYINLGLFGKC